MSFGLSNTLTSFQGYINNVLAKKLDIFMIIYLDNIMIYTIWYILNQLKKYLMYAYLKKYQFYQDQVQFLDYVILLKNICKEDKWIEVVHDWAELQLVQDIYVFLKFANLYWHFIQGFSFIITPLTYILKTIEV